jgi:hypothetical protein
MAMDWQKGALPRRRSAVEHLIKEMQAVFST